MTLDELGAETCEHPAERIPASGTRPVCETCGAMKIKGEWVGGSLHYNFDVDDIKRRHWNRVNAMFTH